ncbi:hypothetical protein Clacol_005144 [Clathrus columnatus]|uniref:BTB domain-containing protein n=1 Tax=Clathrus columnatus TaxID=1419009 RepID=A0AAV5AD37_9AGAM|nr:hypothetical protein Clacol_005144 [Clathrus columnatus]
MTPDSNEDINLASPLTSSFQDQFVSTARRHHDLWFDDGSIVLRANNPTTLFRVHRAMLARHSEVFRNMFAIPQPQSQPRARTISSQESRSGTGTQHHKLSLSVDFVKEPIKEVRMMGSLSRRLSVMGAKTDSLGPLKTNEKTEGGHVLLKSDTFGDIDGALQNNSKEDDFDDAKAEIIEGCEVIDMYDSSQDVASLLHALYDGPQWSDNSPADFSIVSGVLRLAHKYLIDVLRSKALEHLHQAWPMSLQGWDLREEMVRERSGLGNNVGSKGLENECHPGQSVTTMTGEGRFPHPIRVINLARIANAPSLLPSAFYELSRLTFSQIFEGMQTFHLVSNAEMTLSPSDVQKLSMGKEQSHQAVTSLITNLGNVRCSMTGGGGVSGVKMWSCALGYGHNYSPQSLIFNPSSSVPQKFHHSHSHSTCHSPVSCRKDFAELVELATQHYLFDRERGHTDPLYVADELGQLKSAEYSECRACAVALECWSMRERERMWKVLPAWFRLGSGWESLT